MFVCVPHCAQRLEMLRARHENWARPRNCLDFAGLANRGRFGKGDMFVCVPHCAKRLKMLRARHQQIRARPRDFRGALDFAGLATPPWARSVPPTGAFSGGAHRHGKRLGKRRGPTGSRLQQAGRGNHARCFCAGQEFPRSSQCRLDRLFRWTKPMPFRCGRSGFTL